MDVNAEILTIRNETFSLNDSGITLEYLNDEETKRRIVPLVYLGLLSAFGIPGNLFIIYIYLVKFEKKAVHRTFVVALAVTDFLVCGFAIPFEIAQMTREYTFYSQWLCKFGRLMRSFLTLSSALILVALSANRYRCICHPLLTQLQLNCRQALICIIVILCFSFLVALPEVALSGIMLHSLENNLTGMDCSDSQEYVDTMYPTIYSSGKLILFTLCMIVLLIMCILIGRVIGLHEKFRDQFRLKKLVLSKKESKACFTTAMCIAGHSEVYLDTEKERLHTTECDKHIQNGHLEHIDKKNDLPSSKCAQNELDIEDNRNSLKNAETVKFVQNGSATGKNKNIRNLKKPNEKQASVDSYRTSVRSQAETPSDPLNKPRKITYTALAVSICFIIVFLPYAIIKLLGAVKHGNIMPPSTAASILFPTFSRSHLINNVVNFFIYLRLDRAFRRHCKEIICIFFSVCRVCNIRN